MKDLEISELVDRVWAEVLNSSTTELIHKNFTAKEILFIEKIRNDNTNLNKVSRIRVRREF